MAVIKRITINQTPRLCNWRCVSCPDHSPWAHEEIPWNLPWERVEVWVREIHRAGHLQEIIPGTRGEPLVNPDMPRFVELARELDLQINLLTNGSFPGEVAYWQRVFSGIRLKTQFGITRPLRELQQQGILKRMAQWSALYPQSITLQIALSTQTWQDIFHWMHWASQHQISRIKINPLVEHFPELQRFRLTHPLRLALRKQRWQRVAQVLGISLQGQLFASIMDNKCPFFHHELWLDQQGVHACPNIHRPESGPCPENCPYTLPPQ